MAACNRQHLLHAILYTAPVLHIALDTEYEHQVNYSGPGTDRHPVSVHPPAYGRLFKILSENSKKLKRHIYVQPSQIPKQKCSSDADGP